VFSKAKGFIDTAMHHGEQLATKKESKTPPIE
jgi:hypothetical protein